MPTLKTAVAPLLFLVGLGAALWWRRPAAEVAPVATQMGVIALGSTMGTTWSAKVPGATNADKVQRAVQGALDAVDGSMSTYDPTSELSVINATQQTDALALSASLLLVLRAAERVSLASGGAFDVTVAPLVDLWGFGPVEVTEAPSQAALDLAREAVGMGKLSLGEGHLQKVDPRVRIDLSAIAKGYGVDQASAALEALGYTDMMVEVGGEIRVRGHNAEGLAWQVGVEQPDGTGAVTAVLGLAEGAMATSGDYRNYRERDGKRISHTIDPRTGAPIEHALASVSIIDDTCMMADAWATAVNVLGPEEGLALAEREGLAAMLIVRTGDGFETRASAAWPDQSR